MNVLIIAEAGVNHNGNIDTAKYLIEVAAAAGADYVKFQAFKTENLVSTSARKADYQLANTKDGDDNQFNMLKKLELDKANHLELISHCQQKSIKFLSTAFDLESIDLLDELGIDLYKIPSGEITNLPYLKKIASKKKKVILSTGMSNLKEIEAALKILYTNGLVANQVTILHCNTEYPTPMRDVNLKAMNTIEEYFKVKVGYSDHTLGIEVPIAAVAMGAVCIEKHFTLDRNMEGPDHVASLEPAELKAMVQSIRNIEMALGNGIKQASVSEKKNINVVRKSLHLAENIFQGEMLRYSHLKSMRPGNGISPMQLNSIVGKITTKDLKKGELLLRSDFS